MSSSQCADMAASTPNSNLFRTCNDHIEMVNVSNKQNGNSEGTYAKRKDSSSSKGKHESIFKLFGPKTSISAAEDPTTCNGHHQPPQGERRKLNQLRKASSAFLTILRIDERDIALFKTLVIILACYVLSTVPLGILFVVSFGEPDKRYVVPAKALLILSLINSLLNPIIYMMRFKEMKDEFKKMFCIK